MADLWQLQALMGPGGYALLGLSVVGLPVWLALVGATAARYRVPAPLWWLLPVGLVCTAAGAGIAATQPVAVQLAAADALVLQPMAIEAWQRVLAPRAIAWFGVTGWCLLTAVAVALVGALRIEHPKSDWLSGVLPIATGSAICAVASAVALITGTPLPAALSLIAASAASILAVGIASSRTSLSRTERVRIGASRALVVSFALAGVLALGLGWSDLLRALALSAAAAPAAPGTGPVLPAATAFCLAVAASGLPTLGTARGALLSLRAVASGLGVVVLLSIGAGALWAGGTDSAIREGAQGGAIARLPDALWTHLPRSQDLADVEEPADPIDGSCLISEAPDGWTAEPLFAAIPPDVHVARNVTNPDAVHELDRSPGCPAVPGALSGPLASSEIAVVALDAQRAAAALGGWEWFRDRGSLRVLVQPDPLATADWPENAVRAHASSVPFLWERPPAVRPPEGFEAGTWDATWAAQLPVTLLEGPYPILVAGGLRSRLPPGELGVETLQLALSAQPPHRRDLVLVPRKSWTVQDVVGFCLAVHGRVDGARCVIRPETPARWSVRTQLPLPW